MEKKKTKKQTTKNTSKTKQTILAIAIALITVFFIAYAIQTIYPTPNYEEYCNPQTKPINYEPTTEITCINQGGTWNQYPQKEAGNQTGYCDLYTKCSNDYNQAREPYERNVFIINLTLGLIILLTAFFLNIEAISTGFMGAGTILMIYGTMRYWGELSDAIRTILLGIALGILVYFGYKKLKD